MSDELPAEWRRLDPLMLLVHPVTEIGRFLPLVIAAFLFGNQDRGNDWWQWIAVVAPVVIGLTRFLMTTYRITDERVELRRGLLGRSVVTARLDRVRTVELTASPVHRVLGLAKVRIGTGATSSDENLELDALRSPAAAALRHSLLARVDAAGPDEVADGVAGSSTDPTGRSDDGVPLLRFDAGWVRFAPFTSVGLVIAGALFAGLAQLGQASGGDREPGVSVDVGALGAVVLVGLLVLLLVGYVVLSIIGYAVTYGGYRLSTDGHGRTLHVVRGLLTRHETTLETQRIRGLELQEPLSLRLVGAGRLFAAVTGLGRANGGTSLLVPPAPRRVLEYVGQGILHGEAGLVGPLREHGPAARRRRYIRAVLGLGVPAAGLVVAAWLRDLPWLNLPAVLLLAAVLPLARDRYRRLGHGLTEHYLVTRGGSIRGRRVVLERDGIIGWNIEEDWFQRRAGLCDLVATTSAGRQSYRIIDIPLSAAIDLADAAVPGLVSQFRSAS